MDQLKSTSATASPDELVFDPGPGGSVQTAPRRWALIVSGMLALSLVLLAAAAPGWRQAFVEPAPLPLSGEWTCSLAGQPIGKLSIDGWSYVLAGQGEVSTAGTLEPTAYRMKYDEDLIKVPTGALRENFGVRLGYHFHLADKPELLIFNVGPGDGIRCGR